MLLLNWGEDMRILLAEDERDIANVLQVVLKRNNYEVDWVGNGVDFVDYIETGNYDLAVLDIMMPKMDGLSALKIIRDKGCAIPVILLTAKSEVDDKVKGLDSGSDDYLTKPFATKELLARIRMLLRRNKTSTDNELAYGNIVLSRVTYLLKGPKQEFKLASKEFQLLELLLQQPGAVISTEMFMDKIWGYQSESEINVVWTHISYIRKKLKEIGSNVAIKASRGAGYYLEVSDD